MQILRSRKELSRLYRRNKRKKSRNFFLVLKLMMDNWPTVNDLNSRQMTGESFTPPIRNE